MRKILLSLLPLFLLSLCIGVFPACNRGQEENNHTSLNASSGLEYELNADGSYYIPVTFEFDNRGSVVPGSFAEVWLLTSKRENVLSLPVSAITEEQGLYFVYLKMDASCYTKREVTLGESDGARTEILSGIKAGDNVVVKGAYNVKLASASNAIPAHTHNH